MDNQAFNPAPQTAPPSQSTDQSFLNQAYSNQPYQPSQGPTPPAPVQAPGNKPDDAKKAKMVKIFMIIGMAFLGLIAIVFIVLFVMMYMRWDEASTNVQGQIDEAVATAVHDKTEELETEFEEREKYPYKTFAGPTDYGALAFEYPKTWSLYVAEDASSGGDYLAYLNADKVNVVSDKTIMSLRVSILDDLTEDIIKKYQRSVEKGDMTVSIYTINGANANLYEGLLSSSTKYYGIVAVFKIRDKTAVLQTDALLFRDDFMRVLDTVRYNV